jgi:hypothetical protein
VEHHRPDLIEIDSNGVVIACGHRATTGSRAPIMHVIARSEERGPETGPTFRRSARST